MTNAKRGPSKVAIQIASLPQTGPLPPGGRTGGSKTLDPPSGSDGTEGSAGPARPGGASGSWGG
eukprot:943258-Pyramimonas_sp.AAC.1